MANIGGNIYGVIQVQDGTEKNAMGERVPVWRDAFRLLGWLGMQTNEQKRASFSAKIEESSHCFLCDYHAGAYALANQDCRMIIKGFMYDVLMIDNPDEMNEQLEISLRRVGAWNG